MYIGSKILYMKNKMYDILASKKKKEHVIQRSVIFRRFSYTISDISSKLFNYFHRVLYFIP